MGEIKGEKGLENDLDRFDLCQKWWRMMLTGQYTVEESLAEITKLGLKDRKGGKISKTTAFRFFHSIFYTGYFYYSGSTHKCIHNAMINLEEFDKVQKIITGKFGGKYDHYGEIQPLPLTGFIKCGECGATITGERKTKHYKNGTSQDFAWYRCKKNKPTLCTQKSYTKADDMEGQARIYIDNLELDPRFIDWVKGVLRRRNKEEFEFDRKQREQLTKKLQDLSKRKEVVYGMKIDGLYTESEYKLKVTEVLKEEADIKERLNSDRLSYWAQVIDDTLNFATQVMELFNSKDLYVKKMVLQILGSDLRLEDQKLYLEAKSQFMFLRNRQNQLFEENGLVGLKEMALQQAKHGKNTLPVSLGAEDGNNNFPALAGRTFPSPAANVEPAKAD